MDERINSMTEAYQKYLDAANAVLAKYHSEGGCQIEATNVALGKLTEQREHFFSACVNAEGFIHMPTKRVRELEVADHTEAIKPGMENLYRMHNLLRLSCQTLTSCFDVMTHQARKLEAAELIYLEDFTQDGSGAHVTGEGNTAASPALSGIDIKRAAPEETVDHNMAYPKRQ